MPQPPSANMGIILPTDHGDDDVWDVILDEALGIVVDRHDHTTGKGVKIPSAALNINADVPWSSGGTPRAITDLKAIDFFPTATASVSALAGALFLNSADNELYWRTITGTNVQLTSGAALNVAAFAGGIGGDYVVSGALVSFDDALDTYLFQQQGAPRPWARMRSGDVDIYETAASIVNRVRLQSPAALAASYALTFPAALPGSTQLLQLSSTGAIIATNTVPGVITAQAGVVASANQHVQVSGVGDYKHGLKAINIAAAAFSPGNNYSTTSINLNPSNGLWSMNVAPNDILGASVPLKTGDRVVNLNWVYDKNTAAANMVFELRTRNGSTVTVRDTVTDSTAGGTFTSRLGINYTLVTDDALFLAVTSSNSLHRFAYCKVEYDRP